MIVTRLLDIRKSLFPRKLIYGASMEVILVRFRLNLFAVMAKFAINAPSSSFAIFETCLWYYVTHFLVTLCVGLIFNFIGQIRLSHTTNSEEISNPDKYIYIDTHVAKAILGRSGSHWPPEQKKIFILSLESIE